MHCKLQTDVKLLQIENIFFRNAWAFLGSEFIWIANALLFLILIDVIVVISAFFVFWWIVCLFILESNFNRDKKINILVSVVIFFDICRQNQ